MSSGRFGRRGGRLVTIGLVGVLAMAAVAVARSSTLGAGKARVGSRSEMIAVNGHGVAVYELLPETTRHLLCTSSLCLREWPPVKVGAGARATKTAAVKGRLGTFRRHGLTQLTLNGHPLYTFIEDGGKRGVANGDGLRSFGGTWHVFKQG